MSRVLVRFACSAALAFTLTGSARAFAQTDPVPAAAGLHTLLFLTSAGQQRAYMLYLPAGYDPVRPDPYPVVMMFHGGNGSALSFTTTLALAGMGTLADQQGKIVVLAQGLIGTSVSSSGYWNLTNAGRDDVGFSQELLDYLLAAGNLNADASLVYAGGYSNGGAFVHKLGAADPTRFRAIADVAGFYGFNGFYGLPGWSPAPPPAGTLLPVFIVHGDADPVVSYGGGPSATFANIDFLSTQATYDAWYANNGCTERSWTAVPVPNPTRSIQTTMCQPGTSTSILKLVTLIGHDHRWPTLANGNYDTVREMLAFFDRQ
jgi:polyhydroxybutyrate depolymerase